MSDNLLELGEIGILRNIPEELTQLTNENGFLIQENSKLKSTNRILGFLLTGAMIYIIYQIYIISERQTEDHEYTDINHG